MKRTETFSFKISPQERKVISDLAVLEGRSQSSTVRAAIMERAQRFANEITEKDGGQRSSSK